MPDMFMHAWLIFQKTDKKAMIWCFGAQHFAWIFSNEQI